MRHVIHYCALHMSFGIFYYFSILFYHFFIYFSYLSEKGVPFNSLSWYKFCCCFPDQHSLNNFHSIGLYYSFISKFLEEPQKTGNSRWAIGAIIHSIDVAHIHVK